MSRRLRGAPIVGTGIAAEADAAVVVVGVLSTLCNLGLGRFAFGTLKFAVRWNT